jgi:hypothetical protein
MSVTVKRLTDQQKDEFDRFVNQNLSNPESHIKELLLKVSSSQLPIERILTDSSIQFDVVSETQAELSTTYIEGPWEWTDLPQVPGKMPGRLISIWGHVNVLGTTYSDRLDQYTFAQNFEGIYLARETRVLILYT